MSKSYEFLDSDGNFVRPLKYFKMKVHVEYADGLKMMLYKNQITKARKCDYCPTLCHPDVKACDACIKRAKELKCRLNELEVIL